MNRLPAICIAIAAALWLAGCGSVPQPLPGAHQTARELNIAGNKALGKGDFGKALELYGQARRVCLSVDDREGAAMNAYNIAAAHRKLGDDDSALGVLDELLGADAYSGAGPGILAKAAYMRGVIRVSAEDTDGAASDAALASGYCAQANDCTVAGRILNLKARTALVAGDYTTALTYAAEGLGENESAGDMAESANSHRLIGDAHSRMGNLDEAYTAYEAALAIDKALGLPNKVGRDIESIGATLCRSGNHIEARKYFKRACTAYLNAGETDGYETSNELLNVCYTHPDI